jgi:hypothetical protein
MITKPLQLITLFVLLLSCTSKRIEAEKRQVVPKLTSTFPSVGIEMELTEDTKAAMDALTELQISSDEKDQLYSTFANNIQPFYPPDTSFTISRSELLFAMTKFATKHYQNLSLQDREKLVQAAVLAQQEYKVLYCLEGSSASNYENDIPYTGTWVLPNILGRRDLILIW